MMQTQGEEKHVDEHALGGAAAAAAADDDRAQSDRSPSHMSSVVAHLHSRVMHATKHKDKASMMQFMEHLEPGTSARVAMDSGAQFMKASAYLKALTGR